VLLSPAGEASFPLLFIPKVLAADKLPYPRAELCLFFSVSSAPRHFPLLDQGPFEMLSPSGPIRAFCPGNIVFPLSGSFPLSPILEIFFCQIGKAPSFTRQDQLPLSFFRPCVGFFFGWPFPRVRCSPLSSVMAPIFLRKRPAACSLFQHKNLFFSRMRYSFLAGSFLPLDFTHPFFFSDYGNGSVSPFFCQRA